VNKKNTGSYYTPDYLANFISKRVLAHFKNRARISILEPSVGDGAFVRELKKADNLSINITALDINQEELNKASAIWGEKKSEFRAINFIEFATKKKFSIVLGNPPYIKKGRLTKKQINLCKEIHLEEKLSEKTVKNIWATFLVKSTQLLANNGVLAFVLPSELLQVKFAEEIREYLKRQFQRIEIFTFNDLMFDCKGQDTVVLFAYKKAKKKGEFFTNITSREILQKETFILKKNNILVESNVKWTHHFLTSEELSFLNKLNNKLQTVNYYCSSRPGIVTAANNFFIINAEKEKEYKLANYTKPIIQKGFFVNGSVVFGKADFKELENSNHPTRLLQINNKDKISKPLKKYLESGKQLNIHERYKCKLRKNWYVIPNISSVPDAFFFKRCHLYPKLLKNNSAALVTDSAYKIEMNNNFDLNSFIYSFYNSLTLVFAEIEGRYYGGGVLELTPSEFKKLPIPYTVIDNNQFNDFTINFENKESIKQILSANDSSILNRLLNLDSKEIEKLQFIRKKLISKRLRKSSL